MHPCFNDKEIIGYAAKNRINFSPSGLIKEMNANNVERVVAISLYTKYNDSIATLAKENKRILAVAAINIRRISNKLNKELANKKFGAIKLYPGYQHFYPNEKKCKKIYRIAERHEIPVIFHSGDVLVTPTTKNAKVRYANPIYIDDVAVENPGLKIVIAHAGNPWIIDATEVAYKNENVFLDISGWFLSEISGHYAEIMRDSLKYITAYAGFNKILYGTDWPVIKMKHYINFVKGMKFRKSDLEKIFYKNALKVFW